MCCCKFLVPLLDEYGLGCAMDRLYIHGQDSAINLKVQKIAFVCEC